MSIAPVIRVMGIVNVTPDSFSDGGRFFDLQDAVKQAGNLIDAGADVLDIGGESTRPYAEPVTLEHELDRVIPVIKKIRQFSDIPISIDTTKAQVARRAIDAGATIINDISALRHDPAMIEVAAQCDGEVIIMHMLGSPETMQDNPSYRNVVDDIIEFFADRLEQLTAVGIDRNRIIIDPGIGFGKKLDHNLSLIRHLERFSELGRPLLLGHSRKRFLGDITGLATPDRDQATAVVAALCLDKNVSVFRVHDVAATKQALQVARAIAEAD